MARLVLFASLVAAAATALLAAPPAHGSPFLDRVDRIEPGRRIEWGNPPSLARFSHRREHRARPRAKHHRPAREAAVAAGTILDNLSRDRRFTKLVELISDAGLRDDFTGTDQKTTVFAPTNEALMALAPTLKHIKGDKAALAAVIKYHTITGKRVARADLADRQLLETDLELDSLGSDNNKQVIQVTTWSEGSGAHPHEGRVLLNMYARIDEPDIPATNGIIHAISDVLIPPERAFTALTMFPAHFGIQAMALSLTGLDKRVDETEGVTALVALDSTWKGLGMPVLMELFHPHNRDTLKTILENHYADGIAYSTTLDDGVNKVETWAGKHLGLEIKSTHRGLGKHAQKVLHIDGTPAILEDLPAANGVVHIVNTVFINKIHNKDE